MPTIEETFILHNARSSGFSSYETGKFAFVTNGFRQNGVLGFVEPKARDKVFEFCGIAVSAFCEATVQFPPFLARGNGGSGLIVLEPRNPMSLAQLVEIAAHINQTLQWRFSWYRQASISKIARLSIPDVARPTVSFDLKSLLPRAPRANQTDWKARYEMFRLDTIFDLKAGDYHSAANLELGDTPLVSCGDTNNGIIGFVSVPIIHDHKLTIAFNGHTLTTKYHPYQFAAKDDVAVCKLLRHLRISTLLFIQMTLNQERWRYSYYRKCYMDKLKRFQILLPAINGNLDEDAMQAALESSLYAEYVISRLST